jgi:hypothetical protein
MMNDSAHESQRLRIVSGQRDVDYIVLGKKVATFLPFRLEHGGEWFGGMRKQARTDSKSLFVLPNDQNNVAIPSDLVDCGVTLHIVRKATF